MILKQCLLVLLAMFLVMGCVGAVSADDEPKINSFTANSIEVNVNSPVTFTFSVDDNTTSLTLKYFATDSENNVFGQTSASHTYSTPGPYVATLTATNATSGMTDIKTLDIQVNEIVIPLTASFIMYPTSGTAPLSVQFSNTSTGSPNSWAWDFGDGDSSLNQNPTHTFSSAGTYTVSLTVSKEGMESSTTSHNITVSPAPTLTNITSLSVTELTAPVYSATPDTTFVVSGGGTPVSVSWNAGASTFGENTQYTATITIQNASGYVFTAAKPTVSLNGDSVSSTYVTVNPSTQLLTISHTFPATAAKILPTITLSANVTSGTVSLPVKFTYNITNATSTSWTSWTYGDGSTASLSSLSGTLTHTYTSVGNYTANLTATNANGTVYKTVVITVKKVGLDASFTASSASGTAPLTVLFVDTSAGSPTQWIWDFGGLGSSTLKNPSYTFTTAGTYIVKLTIIDNTGATDSYSRAIYVNAPVTTTSTPTATPTPASLTTLSIGEVVIPAPLDIIKEFMHLFYSLFDSTNYVFIVNES